MPVPADVLLDAARVVGTKVVTLERLPGGLNAGAVRVRLAGRPDGVLKVEPRSHAGRLDEALRARRVVERMRDRGYPTPAWLGVGATDTHVWSLGEFVDAAPSAALTVPIVEQLIEVVELQAGQAAEDYDHAAFASRLVADLAPAGAARSDQTTEQARLRRSVATLPAHSPEVASLVERLRVTSAGRTGPLPASDMVHADLSPGNVLVRGGSVVAVVDLGNAGRGTRATDLTTLLWHTFADPLDAARRLLWARILDLVGRDGAAVLLATQVLLQLEWPVRLGRSGVVSGTVQRGHRALDELALFS